MAITALQKEKWAIKMLSHLETGTVCGQVCDTDLIPMEGGDTWHIVTPTAITTASTNDGADITYSLPTDADTSVTKNFDQYFGLLKLDTNSMQIGDDRWFEGFTRNGVYQLGKDLDTAVLADNANFGSNSYETGTTGWTFTFQTCAEIPTFFARLLFTLRTNAVDQLGMPFLVGPPGLGEAIDTYSATRATQYGDEILLAGGARVFTYGGFRVYISNNCDTDGGSMFHGMCGITGHGMALGTYATPSMLEDVGRAEGRFGNLIRGRLAAGYKVYRSAALIDVNFADPVVATS